MDDLDRILSEDDTLVPSAGFAARVMDAVRDQAAAPQPLPLPWRRLVLAPALTLGLVVVAVARIPLLAAVSARPWYAGLAEGLVPLQPLLAPTGIALGAVLASLLVVKLSLMMAGARR